MDDVENRIRNLALAGIFDDGEFIGIENASAEGKGQQLMSEVFHFRLTSLKNGLLRERAIFVKVQLKDEQKAKDFSTAIQFDNEVAMYGTILPELGAFEIGVAIEMLHGHSTDGQDMNQDIIILEDLRPLGYRISEKLFQDYNHVALAMRKLGEYHGLSYKIKQKSPETFEKFRRKLRSRKFKLAEGIFEGALYRGFEQFIDNPTARDAHRKLHAIIIDGKGNKVEHPDEPFAVINHGDFNQNNIMYKYDENGKAVSVVFIDFANSAYSDPAGDVSFFLFMNTSHELRLKHWDDFLEIYWGGIASVCSPGFTKEQFFENFAKRAIWGYIPCCFFLPLMMFPTALKEKEILSNRKSTYDERHTFGMTSGGEDATVAVSNIIRLLLDKGYLEEFAYNF